MADQELPECWCHPDKLCPGECQYILARGLCAHDLTPGGVVRTYEGTVYPQAERLRAIRRLSRKEPSKQAGRNLRHGGATIPAGRR